MILENSNFVVGIAFVAFLALLWRFDVQGLVIRALDARADKIRLELEEAKRLREEAQNLYASYERKQQEVEGEVQDIIAHARREAEEAGEQARRDLEVTVARRIRAAEEQISQAEADAVREVRNEAIRVAVDAAADAIAQGLSKAGKDRLIDEGIKTAADRLH
ncbi:MAG TPA: ATP F0F1 synthase subunit B [Paracoccaceae bacterium]|nr:ATP F0F1 synthase subunit B [Paracoccaceae bacterium]